MAEPFEDRSEGVLSKVIGGRRGCMQEVERLLARADRVSEVGQDRVAEVASRHKVDFGKRMRTGRTQLYRRFLEHCLRDGHLSEEESEALEHLRSLLRLDDESASRVHDEVSRSVYGEAVDEVLEDQQLDPEEQEFLERLRGRLDIPEPVADALLKEGVQRARQRFFSKAAARSGVFLTSHEAPLQLVGASETSIEAAVNDALDQACRAVPRLHWIEVGKIRGEVVEGRVKEWQVELKAWLDPE
ncbi:MAG: dodecin domain-containing protein [Myxococcota bacterium]